MHYWKLTMHIEAKHCLFKEKLGRLLKACSLTTTLQSNIFTEKQNSLQKRLSEFLDLGNREHLELCVDGLRDLGRSYLSVIPLLLPLQLGGQFTLCHGYQSRPEMTSPRGTQKPAVENLKHNAAATTVV